MDDAPQPAAPAEGVGQVNDTIQELFDPPLQFVLEHENVLLERYDNKFIGLCPFHDDSEPSFALWRYNDRDFVGCWACGFGPTDAIGFIRRLHGVTFAESLVIIRRIGKAMPDDWSATILKSTSVKDGSRDFSAEAREALSYEPGYARQFLAERGFTTSDTDWVLDRYRIGGDEKYLVVPHYTPSGRHVTGIKTRVEDERLDTLGGGTLSFLYGCWLDEGQPYVVLTEGESDCWRMAAYYRHDARILVLSLPSGAKGPKPPWLKTLEGRRLLIIFDGDKPGRDAAEAWRRERLDARIVDPGEGLDASDLTDDDLRRLLA